ncbi:Cytosolic Fe-S cluster assembly factor nar1 [Microbotryomycetes sp. JL201]|nr:Cytosolic Fe-S cluster assembly factor nar1 [Microbotryomycetes sp. JL201]
MWPCSKLNLVSQSLRKNSVDPFIIPTLTDLSDYLAPSQICIKPVTVVEEGQQDSDGTLKAQDADKAAATTEIVIDEATSSYYERHQGGPVDGKGKKLKKAEITLNDCLACSGCITSAESVLVQMQSHEEVYRVLREQPQLVPILSIAPQSVASLATLHNLSLEETMRGLRLFFKRELGFRLVFDTTFAREVSLDENRREFLERRAHAASNPQQTFTVPAPNTEASSPLTSSSGPLPILSSACPGWICYAEKTHGELLPFVSNVKSPQAIMGTIVKGGHVAAELDLRPDQIYHVTVMPCYDKKLEASRPDFATPYAGTSSSDPIRDVDCVLTTGEVARILSDKGFDLIDLVVEAQRDSQASSGDVESHYVPSLLLSPSAGTSSGGYVHNALQAVLSTLPDCDRQSARIVEKRVRSDDYVEYSLVVRDDVVVSKAIKCYGFRNLQNIVRKIGKEKGISVTRGAAGRYVKSRPSAGSAGDVKGKSKQVEVEFVEVMACPGGCVNGGGQIAPPSEPVKLGRRRKTTFDANGVELDDEGMPNVSEALTTDDNGLDERILSPKEWVAEVEKRYWSDGSKDNVGDVSQVVNKVVRSLVDGATDPGRRRLELLRTSYRAVESEEVNGLAVKW